MLQRNTNSRQRLKAMIPDRAASLLRSVSSMTTQMELVFDQQLDEARLGRAFELTLDAEPVLGCRFVPHWRKPYWEKLDPVERKGFVLTTEEMRYQDFKSTPVDSEVGPQLSACLWRAPGGDRLLLKVAHEAADAAALKDQIVVTLSASYNRLKKEPNYQASSNVHGSRGLWQVMRRLPWYVYPRVCVRSFREDFWPMNVAPKAVVRLMSETAFGAGPVEFICRVLSADRVSRLVEYGRRHNATLNDLMLCAFFRTLASETQWEGREELKAVTSVDLRRWYLPRNKHTSCNLSAVEYVNLGNALGHDFTSTLKTVAGITRSRKADFPGVSTWIAAFPLFVLPHMWAKKLFSAMTERALRSRTLPEGLLNGGDIRPDAVSFEVKPLRALFLPPTRHPPNFWAIVSGYQGTITVAVAAYPSQKTALEHFFDSFVCELPG